MTKNFTKHFICVTRCKLVKDRFQTILKRIQIKENENCIDFATGGKVKRQFGIKPFFKY